jgi:hypothetical protein
MGRKTPSDILSHITSAADAAANDLPSGGWAVETADDGDFSAPSYAVVGGLIVEVPHGLSEKTRDPGPSEDAPSGIVGKGGNAPLKPDQSAGDDPNKTRDGGAFETIPLDKA